MVTIRNRPRQESQFLDVFDEDQIQKAVMYRKAKSDEGAERIQNQINQLGQLPSITPEGSKYIQDKVSDLVNTTNSIVGLDTSNQFNINKLSAMGNEITDDSYIQATVSSAKNHQKNMKYMEDAKMNPKKYGNVMAVQNEDDYNRNLSNYRKDISEGKNIVFNYTYKPFKDVEGTLSKQMEKIKADVSMGRSGDYFTKDEIITPDKIRNVAYGMISSEPSLSEQMRINSNYATRGVTDEQLISQKNGFQIQQLKEKERELQREVNNLYGVDLNNPKETARLVKQYKDKVSKYESYAQDLISNPHKLINIDTGQEDTSKYNRSQTAYELSMLAMGNNFANTFSVNKRTLTANPIPLGREKFDWEKQMNNLDYQLSLRDEARKDEELFIKKKAAELDAKEKLTVSGNGQLSVDVPGAISAVGENPDVAVNQMVNEQKGEAKQLLKNMMLEKFRNIQGIAGGGANQQYLDRFVDGFFEGDKVKYFNNDNKLITDLQSNARNTGGVIPDRRLIEEGLKHAHKISLTVKNIWNNDAVVSPEDAKFFKEYTDKVHQITTIQAAGNYANEAGAKASGFANKAEYDKFFKDNNKEYKTQTVTLGGNYGYTANVNSPEVSGKINAFNTAKADYYTKRLATTKMYPIINFNPDAKNAYDINTTIGNHIKSGAGVDITGKTSFGTTYGKTNKWSELDLGADASIVVKSINPKTEIVTAEVSSGEGGKTKGEYKFHVNPAVFGKFIPEEAKQANQPFTYDNALDFGDNGTLQNRVLRNVYDKNTGKTTSKYVIEDVWKTMTNDLAPLTWKAQRVDPKNIENRRVYVYLKLPVDGESIPIKLKGDYANAAEAEKLFTGFANDAVKKLLKNNTPIKEIKRILPQYLQQLNGGI